MPQKQLGKYLQFWKVTGKSQPWRIFSGDRERNFSQNGERGRERGFLRIQFWRALEKTDAERPLVS